MNSRAITTIPILKVNNGIAALVDDHVSVEEPMEIQLLWNRGGAPARKSISITMRTPGDDAELAAGFLFTEGLLTSSTQVYKIAQAPGDENRWLVSLSADAQPVLNGMERNFYTTSACGICGKASIDAIRTVSVYRHMTTDLNIPYSVLLDLPGRLLAQQEIFGSTGGLHAAALFSAGGDLLRMREDVGRHNALDKLIGGAFLQDELPLVNALLMLSGRASFELVQKAAMAGICIVAAVGAPSSLAVSLAEEAGITLIGFLRKDRFNIYTHPERIVVAQEAI